MRNDRATAQRRLREQIGIDRNAMLLKQLIAGLESSRDQK
jgi:hypothetical protein